MPRVGDGCAWPPKFSMRIDHASATRRAADISWYWLSIQIRCLMPFFRHSRSESCGSFTFLSLSNGLCFDPAEDRAQFAV
jgi:hypothetical protein